MEVVQDGPKVSLAWVTGGMVFTSMKTAKVNQDWMISYKNDFSFGDVRRESRWDTQTEIWFIPIYADVNFKATPKPRNGDLVINIKLETKSLWQETDQSLKFWCYQLCTDYDFYSSWENSGPISFWVLLLFPGSKIHDAHIIEHRLFMLLYLERMGNGSYMHFGKNDFQQIYVVLNSS